MKTLRAGQSGISLIGFIIVLGVVGIFAYLGMKIFPAYSEYYNVVSAMEKLAREPGSARWTPGEILGALDRQLGMNYVNEAHVNRRSFQIKRAGNGYTVALKYEVREQLVYNLDYVAKFEKTVVLGSALGQN